MKRRTEFRAGGLLLVLAVAIVASTAACAAGSSLQSVARTSSESQYNHAPWDFASWLGLTGPGDGYISWHTNGSKTMVNASVMNNVSWWQVWRYGSTNSAADTYTWVDIYRLAGTPGTSADISLSYEFEPFHLNYAVDGRTQSVANVQLAYGITSADVSTADKLLAFNAAFPSETSSQVWDYTKKYYFACFTWGDDEYLGTLPLGTAAVGDYLWIRGTHTAAVEAQAYGPGFTGAVIVSPFEYSLTATDVIPAPGAVLLAAMGLFSLARCRRRVGLGN